MRDISSLVLAPVAAASVLPIWRRSWKRRPSTPTRRHARCQAAWRVAGRIGPPVDVTNSNASGSDPTFARCCSRSGTIAAGMATVRTPASVFGGPSTAVPLASCWYCSTTRTVRWSRSMRFTRSARISPSRSLQNVASSTAARNSGSIVSADSKTSSMVATGRSAGRSVEAPRTWHGLRSTTPSSTAVANTA